MGTKRDWTKAQPHHAESGRITSRAYAERYPEKVVWVRVD